MRLFALVLSMFVLSASAAERESIALDSRLLHGGNAVWQMIKAGEARGTGAEISSPGYPCEGWKEAVVPGTVLSNLVKQGVYPEPYYGQNNKLKNNLIPDLFQAGRDFYTYWFRTEVSIPETFKGRRIWVEPTGINYRAEVWINGRLADVMAGMFRSHSIDITDWMNPEGKVVIAMKVFPVDFPGTIGKRSWGPRDEFHNGGDGWIGQNVTMLMSVGWDFSYEDGIRDRNTGIWRSVRLYATGQAQLRAPMVRSALNAPQYDVARETVSVEVHNPNIPSFEGTLHAVIPEAGISFERPVKLMRGEHQELVFTPEDYPQLVIRSPRLWWPKNKGPQDMYTLRLTLSDKKGNLSDSIQTRFGIREVKVTRDTPDESKLFIVNGRQMFVRGSNWIPETMLRTDDRRMRTELEYTAQSGINFLRLWGGGIVESDLFYELCDELGLMVWQEFFMTGDTRHPLDEPLYLSNVESSVKRIRNHPSIVFYVSSNESTAVSGAEELIQKLDGTRPYQMQSECDGIHDGSPYKHVNPMRHYENTGSERGSRVDGFNPEYGAPTLPILESLRQMMPPEDLWPINRETWEYMEGNAFYHMGTIYEQMIYQYGEPHNIEEYTRRGQLVGAINSKSIWEVWNENKLQYGDRWCSGLLFWYHNCPNMQISSRMWDWNLEPTASLYHTMHALEPLHVQYDYLKQTVSVINDSLVAAEDLKVTAQVYDYRSRRVWQESVPVSVPADGVANDVITVAAPEDISQVYFIALSLQDRQGRELSRNFYWCSRDKYEGPQTVTGPCTSGFQSLAQLPAAKPKARVVRLPDQDGAPRWQVTLSNRSRSIAFFLQLLLVNAEGNAIHSTHYSDNFLSLLPGQQQTILIQAPAGFTASGCQLKLNEGLLPTRYVRLP